MSGNAGKPRYVSLGTGGDQDFSGGSPFPDIFETVEHYMQRLQELRRFLSGLTFRSESVEIDRLHKQLFRSSVLHPQYFLQDAEHIGTGITALKEYAVENEYDDRILETLDDTDAIAETDRDDAVSLNSFLETRGFPAYETTDIAGIEISNPRQALAFWPHIVPYEFDDGRDVTLYDHFYDSAVESIPMAGVYEILERHGLDLLDVIEEFLAELVSSYKRILVELGLLTGGIDDETATDGGEKYRIDPNVIGSVGLSLLGLIAIAGGIGSGNLSVAVSGFVAVLSAIQNWPYEYALDIDIERLE